MTASPARTRAGRYADQAGGYRAFIPNPLPPDPPVELRGELQTLLSQADRALGRLDGSIRTLPHPDLFVAMYVRKEAVLSSQIEGTQSSLQDVLAAEARVLSPDRPRDVDEVFNYVRAMNHGLERLEDLPKAASPAILRTPSIRARPRRLGIMARIFSSGRLRGQPAGHTDRSRDPHTARTPPPDHYGSAWPLRRQRAPRA